MLCLDRGHWIDMVILRGRVVYPFLHSSIETMCLGLEMIPNATGTDKGGGSTGNKGLYARIPWIGGVWVVSSFRNL